MQLTAVLSGPAAARSQLLLILQRAGANVNEQPDENPNHGLPPSPDEETEIVDPSDVGWVTVLVDDLETVTKALERAPDWVLRLHWPTPDCRACEGRKIGLGGSPCLHCLGAGKTNRVWTPPDPLAEMQKKLDELERRLNEVTA